ncbi:MAG TPA: hypothetical protein VFL54_10000 [Gammaproteobacteria bacterium]|nr:hypothetical protein [Gammaproteobacteria bacterium]
MSLFADKTKTVQEMRGDRLTAAAATYFPDVELSDDYIYAKVLAAETDAEHRLRVFFEPVEMVPEGTPHSVIDGYENDKVRWQEEPAYDWDPEFFRGNTWGFFQVRQRPIIAVHSFRFIYPSTDTTIYAFPHDWIRLDKKYGHIRIVPMSNFSTLPLNAWLLSVFAGGRMVPHMIQIAYQAGLKDAAGEYPELLDLIKRMAALRIIEDQFVPTSGSLSVDGISESLSTDTKKYKDIVDARLEALRDQIHGIRVGFV